MHISRQQLGALMALVVFTFGCRAGQLLQVASVVAVATVRVAAVAAAGALAHARPSGGDGRSSGAPSPPPLLANPEGREAEVVGVPCTFRGLTSDGLEIYVCSDRTLLHDAKTDSWEALSSPMP